LSRQFTWQFGKVVKLKPNCATVKLHRLQEHQETRFRERNENSQAPHKVQFSLFTTLRQTYLPDIQQVQFAFKDSMIHFILQFTLLIATGNVLHRCTSQEIHR